MISEDETARVLTQLPRSSFLRTYVRNASRLTDAPLVYHVGVALSLLAAIAPENLEITSAGHHLANFWCVIVGASRDARKTESIKIGLKMLHDVCPDRIHSRPGSVEGLEADLEVQGTRLIAYPEFGEFLSRTTSNRYLSDLREKFTELYDGNPIHRKLSKRSIDIPRPRLSLLGGVTPDYIDDFTSRRDWTGGFFGRFCVFAAQRERLYPELPESYGLTGELTERLQAMVGQTCGPCTGLAPESHDVWDRWYRGTIARFRDDEMSVWARPAAIATPNVALKICLLLALDYGVLGRQESWTIGPVMLNAAIGIAEMHLRSLLWVLDQVGGSSFGRMRKSVLDALIAAEGPATLSQLLRTTQPRLDKRAMAMVLDTLKASEEVFHTISAAGIDVYSLEPLGPIATVDADTIINFPAGKVS